MTDYTILQELPYAIGQDHYEGLAKVGEEMSELGVEFFKLMATGGNPKYWGDKNLHVGISCEVADLYAALDFFVAKNKWFDVGFVARRRKTKLSAYNEWSEETKKLKELRKNNNEN